MDLEQSRIISLAGSQPGAGARVDRRAIEDFGIPGIVLIENAGRGAAEIIRREYYPEEGACDKSPLGTAIVCGGGNNGGDGFVIARHLVNAGTAVTIFLAADPERLQGDALTAFRIVERMGIECLPFHTDDAIENYRVRLREARVIVDAVLGTGFSGTVRPPIDRVIREINAARSELTAIVAVDLPSGLDCDTGHPAPDTVQADVTVTFVGLKAGFVAQAAREFIGKVFVVDIGAPNP